MNWLQWSTIGATSFTAADADKCVRRQDNSGRLDAAGIPAVLDRGCGIDALLGEQSRPRRGPTLPDDAFIARGAPYSCQANGLADGRGLFRREYRDPGEWWRRKSCTTSMRHFGVEDYCLPLEYQY